MPGAFEVREKCHSVPSHGIFVMKGMDAELKEISERGSDGVAGVRSLFVDHVRIVEKMSSSAAGVPSSSLGLSSELDSTGFVDEKTKCNGKSTSATFGSLDTSFSAESTVEGHSGNENVSSRIGKLPNAGPNKYGEISPENDAACGGFISPHCITSRGNVSATQAPNFTNFTFQVSKESDNSMSSFSKLKARQEKKFKNLTSSGSGIENHICDASSKSVNPSAFSTWHTTEESSSVNNVVSRIKGDSRGIRANRDSRKSIKKASIRDNYVMPDFSLEKDVYEGGAHDIQGSSIMMHFSPFQDNLPAVTSTKEQLKEDVSAGTSISSVPILANPGDSGLGTYFFKTESAQSSSFDAVETEMTDDVLKESCSSMGGNGFCSYPSDYSPQKDFKDVSLQEILSSEVTESIEMGVEEQYVALFANAKEEATCEKWRERGNKAYGEGDFSKAEQHYTCGINSHSLHENIRSLMLCYSNRAASRVSLGRIREALKDCRIAISMYPTFLRPQLRAANCLLALGDTDGASEQFRKILESGDVSLDPKVAHEASDGLSKARKVVDSAKQSENLLLVKAPGFALKVLELVSEALLFSTLSDRLMQMKAEALFTLQRYRDVIEFCEETLHVVEKNSLAPNACEQTEIIGGNIFEQSENACDAATDDFMLKPKFWRWSLISKSKFYLGKLEESLQFLNNLKEEKFISGSNEYQEQDFTSLFATIQELLRHKNAGNLSYQAGQYSEAVDHYTAALNCNMESYPFTSICLCNRAAAYQAQNRIVDAIADCSLSIALDANYIKAISRRASLYEMIRDYTHTAMDLRRLLFIMDKQIQENKSQASEMLGKVYNEVNRVRVKLSAVEDETRKSTPLNLYLILGVQPSDSVADVRKAYRKVALRHHPDKACQFIKRSEHVDELTWKEVSDEIRSDADHLFKIIGQAYAVLSDRTKRQQYDQEGKLRTSSTRIFGANS